MPPKKSKAAKTFRHTSANIHIVDPNHLEPGKAYLIQHNQEGLKSIVNQAGISPNNYVTRFKGTFVRHDVGRSNRFPDGIRGSIAESRNVAVFRDVKIISNPNKTNFPLDMYIILVKPHGRAFAVRDFNSNNKSFRKYIEQGSDVVFPHAVWSFGDTMQDTYPEFYANQLIPTQQRLFHELEQGSNLEREAVARPGPGNLVEQYLGHQIPQESAPAPPSLRRENHLPPPPPAFSRQEENRSDYLNVDGGRRHRKSKKSRYSRKRRTIKRRVD